LKPTKYKEERTLNIIVVDNTFVIGEVSLGSRELI
jgi:hypothetical protein